MNAEQLFSADNTAHLQNAAETRKFCENMLQMAWFEHAVKQLTDAELDACIEGIVARSAVPDTRLPTESRSVKEELVIEDCINNADAAIEAARWYRTVLFPSKHFDGLIEKMQADLPQAIAEAERLYAEYRQPH